MSYPIPDDVLRAQQDSANLAFDTKVIPRRSDVRQTSGKRCFKSQMNKLV